MDIEEIKQRVVRLVEAFPDYQITFRSFYDELVNILKKKGYVSSQNSEYICVSKNSEFTHKLHFLSPITNILPDCVKLQVDVEDNVVYSVRNEFVILGLKTDLNNSFNGYDETCRTLPEIWLKLISALYGEIPKIYVKYNFTVIRGTDYNLMEVSSNKLD